MPSLPEPIHERLLSEYRIAATKVAEAEDLQSKLYYFSVFFGEAGRQLNVHWDADLVLMHNVIQLVCQSMLPSIGNLPAVAAPPTDEFLAALDSVSAELVSIFEEPQIDRLRFFTALTRVAELQYICGGNGAYLRQKGMVSL